MMNEPRHPNRSPEPAVSRAAMPRRRFLQAASSGLAFSALGARAAHGAEGGDPRPRRVGLIGAGWYGKSDLWRLIQVAPVEVVSICDPDRQLLAGAVEMASRRQKSKKAPRAYGDFREMLAEKDLEIVLVGSPDHWHALHAIAAIEAGADTIAVACPFCLTMLSDGIKDRDREESMKSIDIAEIVWRSMDLEQAPAAEAVAPAAENQEAEE